jgi:hypothetical protein
MIAEKLVQCLDDHEFDMPDTGDELSAHDYAFDALWQVIENSQH